ncbi:MAG TPA: hypothetical protein VN577_14040 [Terriglobales bacterium]|nr:hypothetical protein [Terriglobales bacterium]
MRQSRCFAGFFFLITLLLLLTACGGGDNNNGGGGGTLTLSLTPASVISVDSGQVQAVVAILKDSNGSSVDAGTIKWSTDKPDLISVTERGGKCGDSLNSTNTTCVCAGKWDADIIVCTPATASGVAKITATNGTYTATADVYVHPRVARVVVGSSTPSCSAMEPPSSDCISAAGTQQFLAKACDASNNEVTIGPADGSGFTWGTSDSNVVKSDIKGLYTAVNPGIASVYASVQNVVSTPLRFSTCAVKSISAHVKDSTDTSFTVDKGGTKTLVADVKDSKGQTITITNSRLSWNSAYSSIAATSQEGSITTSVPGSSAVSVSCTPPLCNNGYSSIFSNTVTANVNGATSTNVYVASPSSTSLYPVSTSDGTIGTAITLPYKPNSFIFSGNGTTGYLGSDTALMLYAVGGTTASTLLSSPGVVLGASNDGTLVSYFNPANQNLVLLSISSSGTASVVASFTTSGVPNPCDANTTCPRASFTPDNKTAYMVSGNTVYVAGVNVTPKTFDLASTPKDVAVSGQGSFAFLAQADNNIVPYATCNTGRIDANIVNAPAAVQRIASTADGSKIYAATAPNLTIISPTSDFNGCVPSLTTPANNIDLGQGAFNVKQLLVSTSGTKVGMITDTTKVVLYDSANGGRAVALTGGATVLTGGFTADGASLYVGGSDKALHRIDVSAGTDAKQITLAITPDLVAVPAK